MNNFQVLGEISEQPYLKDSYSGDFQFTCVVLACRRPGKNGTEILEHIPFEVFGDHIASRGLAVGVWVVVSGRIGAREYNGQLYNQVRVSQIEAVGYHGTDNVSAMPDEGLPSQRQSNAAPQARAPRTTGDPPAGQSPASSASGPPTQPGAGTGGRPPFRGQPHPNNAQRGPQPGRVYTGQDATGSNAARRDSGAPAADSGGHAGRDEAPMPVNGNGGYDDGSSPPPTDDDIPF